MHLYYKNRIGCGLFQIIISRRLFGLLEVLYKVMLTSVPILRQRDKKTRVIYFVHEKGVSLRRTPFLILSPNCFERTSVLKVIMEVILTEWIRKNQNLN